MFNPETPATRSSPHRASRSSRFEKAAISFNWKIVLRHPSQFPLPEERESVQPPPNWEGSVRMVIVVVIRVVGVMIIAMMVGHRVADGRAAHTADHSADGPAYKRPANGARHPASHRSALVSQRR